MTDVVADRRPLVDEIRRAPGHNSVPGASASLSNLYPKLCQMIPAPEGFWGGRVILLGRRVPTEL